MFQFQTRRSMGLYLSTPVAHALAESASHFVGVVGADHVRIDHFGLQLPLRQYQTPNDAGWVRKGRPSPL